MQSSSLVSHTLGYYIKESLETPSYSMKESLEGDLKILTRGFELKIT